MSLNPLKQGDRIALVAPSSPFEAEKFHQVCRLLQARGYELSPGQHLFRRKEYLAGTEEERAEDLIRAITDPSISAVICVRGGYGSGKLLPWLPFSRLAQCPKVFLGFSDVTFLHLAFRSRMNWVTFHGPNLTGMADTEERLDSTLNALEGRDDFVWKFHEEQVLRHGTVSGVILGGNLTCMTHLVGTPYFPDLTGAMLLMEDCGEALYRLDRMITHLKLSGLLPKLQGLILGGFKNCGPEQAILNMIMEQVRAYSFPVISGFPAGHGDENRVIPLGIPYELNTRKGTLEAIQSPFGK